MCVYTYCIYDLQVCVTACFHAIDIYKVVIGQYLLLEENKLERWGN